MSREKRPITVSDAPLDVVEVSEQPVGIEIGSVYGSGSTLVTLTVDEARELRDGLDAWLRGDAPLSNECPACFSRPGSRCTEATNNGRKPVKYEHHARVDAREEARRG